MSFVLDNITKANTDLIPRAHSRLMSQFSRSIVLIDVLVAIVQEVQELSNAATALQSSFFLSTASGVQLDIIGNIVGIPRNSGYSLPMVELKTETSELLLTETGESLLADTGITTSQYEFSDYEYLNAIVGKIVRNSCNYGSVVEVQEFFQSVYNLHVIPVITGPNEIAIMTPVGTDTSLLNAMQKMLISSSDVGIIKSPLPATVGAHLTQNNLITDESGVVICTEDSIDLNTEFVPPITWNGVTYV